MLLREARNVTLVSVINKVVQMPSIVFKAYI